MRPLLIGLLGGWLALPALAAEKYFDFGECKLNETPKGFRSTVTGEGQPGTWKIVEGEIDLPLPPLSPKSPVSNKRPVLAQIAQDPTDEHFPLLLYEEETFGDFTLTTHFKLVSGVVEQMAGIAFRAQDEKNYFYIRASGLGNTFYFFKIAEGVRGAPIGRKIEITKNAWHELTLECKGDQIRVWLDGNEAIPALSDKTFVVGKIGLWTKSDAVSQFRDLKITYRPKEILAQVLVRDALLKFPRVKGLQIVAAAPGASDLKVIASNNPAEVGRPAPSEIRAVIERQIIHHGKGKDAVIVAFPLHDRNGESIAAVKVTLKPFPGQTERNAIARALPIIKEMESRVQSLKDLLD